MSGGGNMVKNLLKATVGILFAIFFGDVGGNFYYG